MTWAPTFPAGVRFCCLKPTPTKATTTTSAFITLVFTCKSRLRRSTLLWWSFPKKTKSPHLRKRTITIFKAVKTRKGNRLQRDYIVHVLCFYLGLWVNHSHLKDNNKRTIEKRERGEYEKRQPPLPPSDRPCVLIASKFLTRNKRGLDLYWVTMMISPPQSASWISTLFFYLSSSNNLSHRDEESGETKLLRACVRLCMWVSVTHRERRGRIDRLTQGGREREREREVSFMLLHIGVPRSSSRSSCLKGKRGERGETGRGARINT